MNKTEIKIHWLARFWTDIWKLRGPRRGFQKRKYLLFREKEDGMIRGDL
jgi:hypothetical protein